MGKIPAPHIGQLLKAYTSKQRISYSSWRQTAGKDYSTVFRYHKRASLQMDTLFEISQTLGHNFLREIADMLPATIPPERIPDQHQRVLEQEQRIKELELQVATLKEALGLIGGK